MRKRTYWYFTVEGRLKEPDPNYNRTGVVTSCLVPLSGYQDAIIDFHEALDFMGISFEEMLDEIEIDLDAFDASDPEDREWIELIEFTMENNAPVFLERHLFDVGS